MIFVSKRRTEQRHDPVPQHLVHGALVAMHRRHHAFQDRVEDHPRFLGVALGEQLHRALDVGEHHRHLLALAFDGRSRAEDALREVLGSVGLRRR